MANNDRLVANPQGIMTAARRIKDAGDEFEGAIKKITQTIRSLEDVWQSDTQRKLADAYQTHEKTLNELLELIGEYQADLNNYANELLELDQQLSRSQNI